MRTTHCSLDISQILNKGAFAGSRQPPSQLQQLQNPSATTQPLNSAQHTAAPAHGVQADTAPETPHESHDAQQLGEHNQGSATQSWQQEPQVVSSHQHGSDAGHGSHGHSHDHAHSHAGHLSSVRSINLIHQGQVDLARYSLCIDHPHMHIRPVDVIFLSCSRPCCSRAAVCSLGLGFRLQP